MKKIICAFLALAMILVLCACGTKPAGQQSVEETPAVVKEAAEEVAETTAETIEVAEELPEGFVTAQVVKTGSGITVKTAAEWEEQYPEIYASYMKNSENESTTDYVEDYPMIGKLYNNMGFYKFYDSARGHNYTVTDITNTGRPHKLANCYTCKSPDMTVKVNNEGDGVYALPAEEVQLVEPISCYNCHANEDATLVVTHTYLSDAMGEDLNRVDARNLSCAQCHNEYYFDPATKATTLPYTNLATMNPDSILDFYNNRLIVEDKSFADYTNPITGVRQIKVQHPEFETFMGEGSVHKEDFTCADCHMGEATTEDGVTYKNHYLSSPLDNEKLIEDTCSACHEDIKADVRELQADMERRTYAIGFELELLHDKLAQAVADSTDPATLEGEVAEPAAVAEAVEGEETETAEVEPFVPAYTEAELDAIRSLARDAQFYWDFVFVENSEGAHNSTLDNQCLDKAEALCNQALKLFH